MKRGLLFWRKAAPLLKGEHSLVEGDSLRDAHIACCVVNFALAGCGLRNANPVSRSPSSVPGVGPAQVPGA
jgi:hypothetical protein